MIKILLNDSLKFSYNDNLKNIQFKINNTLVNIYEISSKLHGISQNQNHFLAHIPLSKPADQNEKQQLASCAS